MSNSSYTPPGQVPENKGGNDQEFEDRLINLSKNLKSNQKFVTCPYCLKAGFTKVEQNCNACTGFLCILGCGVVWAIIQSCRGKDINCRDADHYCVGCGNKLASYKST